MEIRLSEHARLCVDMTQELVKDYRECQELAQVKCGGGKDCRGCSLNEEVFGTGLCEVPAIMDVLRARAGRMQGGKEDV